MLSSLPSPCAVTTLFPTIFQPADGRFLCLDAIAAMAGFVAALRICPRQVMDNTMSKSTKRHYFILSIASLLAAGGSSQSIAGTGFAVTTTASQGPGSLRQAIIDANQVVGGSTIEFAIPASPPQNACPQVITLDTDLPDITASMTIDGYTQEQSTPSSNDYAFDAKLCIVLAAPDDIIVQNFLRVPQGSSAQLTVRGLAFDRFGLGGQGIVLNGGSHHRIEGSQFGGTLNGSGYVLGGGMTTIIEVAGSAADVTIGGDFPAQRNVISGAVLGIKLGALQSSGSTAVRNNLIGLDPSGTVDVNTSRGIQITGSGHVVDANVISTRDYGVMLAGPDSHDNSISRNWIGPHRCPGGAASNCANSMGYGVFVLSGAHDNSIGEPGGFGNVIAYHRKAGVSVISAGGGTVRNFVEENRIYSNGAVGNYLAIDLEANGPLDNDAGDADDGANRLQNFPVITQAQRPNASLVHVEGELETSDGSYLVEIYSAPFKHASGRGELVKWLDRVAVTATGGVGHFSIDVPASSLVGDYLSAVAINVSMGAVGDTSEPGPAVQLTPDPDLVFAYGFE